MKILPLALISLSLLSPLAQARLSDEAAELARELRANENSLSSTQEVQISRHLRSIRQVMNSDPANPGRPGENSYVCVSRDNDGRDPWMLGVRDFTNVVRISGTVVQTKQECENNLKNSRYIRGGLLTCFSRDNDGRDPWIMNFLGRDNSLIRLNRAVSTSYQDCANTIRDTKVTREGILYCASRDSDGRSPYVIVGYRTDGSGSQVGNETYSSYEQCRSSL